MKIHYAQSHFQSGEWRASLVNDGEGLLVKSEGCTRADALAKMIQQLDRKTHAIDVEIYESELDIMRNEWDDYNNNGEHKEQKLAAKDSILTLKGDKLKYAEMRMFVKESLYSIIYSGKVKV